MRKLAALALLLNLFIVSCDVDPIAYNDQIVAAHRELLEAQKKVDEVMNSATGKPEQKAAINVQLTSFKQKIKDLIEQVNKQEKSGDDSFKKAFVTYAEGMLELTDHEYKQMAELATLKQEQVTEEISVKEQQLINSINKRFEHLDRDFQRAQEEFAAKHNIQLQ